MELYQPLKGPQAEIRAEQYLIANFINHNIVAVNCSFQIAPSQNVESALLNLRNNLRSGKGASIVCSSGNDAQPYVYYPASSPNNIAVGGTYLYVSGIVPHSEQKKWPSANYGQELDIVAPAWHMFTTDNNNSYTFDYGPDGTSYAAPLVCGAIALMASVNPDLLRTQYETILLTRTNKFGGYNYNETRVFGSWNNEVGYGVLDVNACVRNVYAQNLCINGPITISTNTAPYIATNSITATCNSSTFIINNTGSVDFQSGNAITLLPGFHSMQGSNFRAHIQTTDYLPISPIITYNLQQKTESTINDLSRGELTKPDRFSLLQNYPNPFNPTTLIQYGLKENVRVKITIYDILGRIVKTLVNEFQDAGYKFISWDGTNNEGFNVSTGVYVYKIEAGNFIDSKKMVLLK